MLERLSVTLVLVGHSERRQYFGMTDDDVIETTRAVLAHGLTPVVCVGETGLEREEGRADEVLVRQVTALLQGVAQGLEDGVIVAYEPVWAIGTGVAATADDAQKACATIRGLIAAERGPAAEAVRILYGGSAKAENAAELMALSDVDGLLVGGASLDAESFAAIVAEAATCYGSTAGRS
jgi:triosephosphate isomerase